MTLNRHKGRIDQFVIGTGVDFSSKRGCLTVGHAFEDVKVGAGGATPTTSMAYILQTSKDGYGYLFGDDTKQYYISAAGANIFEANDSAQSGVFKGAMEYKEHLLYAQDTTIGNKPLSAAATAGWVDNRITADVANVPYHSMYEAPNKVAYICNDNNISSITDPTDSGSFTKSALALPAGWQAVDIDDFGYRYTAIAANFVQGTNEPSKCKIFLWDRSSATTWQDEIEIPETKIKAIKWSAGNLWVWAGKSCNIYVVPETTRKPFKMFQFVREDPTIDLNVYPGAVCVRGGTIYFGLGGLTSAEAIKDIEGGVYSFPADPNKFSLNRPYARTWSDNYKGLGIIGNRLYVSEDQGSSVYRLKTEMLGATDLHYSSQGQAWTFEYKAPVGRQMYIEYVGVEFDKLPSTCSIDVLYVKNGDDTNRTLFQDFDTTGATEKIAKFGERVDSIQFLIKVQGAASGTDYNDRPFIKRFYATGYLITKNGPR